MMPMLCNGCKKERMSEDNESKPKRCTHGFMTCPMCEWVAGEHKPPIYE